MKNRKGFLGELLIFLFAVAVVSVFFYMVYFQESVNASMLEFNDRESSASILADAIVNNPDCLLYTEDDNVGGTLVILSNRNVIDWTKAQNLDPRCVTKGPYIAEIRVRNEDTGDEKFLDDSCINPGSQDINFPGRKISVLMMVGDNLHNGSVTVNVGRKDFLLQMDKARSDQVPDYTDPGTAEATSYTADDSSKKSDYDYCGVDTGAFDWYCNKNDVCINEDAHTCCTGVNAKNAPGTCCPKDYPYYQNGKCYPEKEGTGYSNVIKITNTGDCKTKYFWKATWKYKSGSSYETGWQEVELDRGATFESVGHDTDTDRDESFIVEAYPNGLPDYVKIVKEVY